MIVWTEEPTMPNKSPKTLIEAVRYFDDPDVCNAFMAEMRRTGT